MAKQDKTPAKDVQDDTLLYSLNSKLIANEKDKSALSKEKAILYLNNAVEKL